jgi:hypothetical protein
MKLAKELSSLKQFKDYGSRRGFLITIPGSVVFATSVLIFSPYTWSNIFGEFIGHFILGMICSFPPAILGGMFLASRIYKRPDRRSAKSGIVQGALTGLCSMFIFNLMLTPTPFVNNHLIASLTS